jgi:hypothetical protein
VQPLAPRRLAGSPMSLVGFLVVMLALAISLVPVWLLRRPDTGLLQDETVSSQPAPPAVVRNASIAYALRMAAFGSLFAWGASGDLWPAIIGAASLALGFYLMYRLRLPLLVFLHDALRRDRSISVHAFIARHHGDDPRIRRLAASLTLFALLGLLVGEALGLAAVLEPLLADSAAVVYALASGALLLTVLPAILAGHSGVMHSAQLQLGLLYLGLFSATALLLYLHLSALTPLPPHGTLAIVFVAVCCAALLWYRRSKYVDTERIGQSPGARLLSRLAKIFNPCLSILIVLVIVIAAAATYAAGVPDIARQAAAALSAGTRVPSLGLLALCLLPLFYPLVDIAHWQRLAALAKGLDARGADPARRTAAVRGVFTTCAAESAVVWLFLCLLGAIAVAVIGTPEGTNALQGFVSRLVTADDGATAAVLPLLLICAFAVALSTMSALFSAAQCTIRCDLLAADRPEQATRRTLAASAGFGVAFAAAFGLAEATLPIRFGSGTFLALVLAVACAQLSFAPLVLGPIGSRSRGAGTVRPAWALAILGAGTAAGAAAVVAFFATQAEAWLWAAVPACLGTGFALFAVARRWPAGNRSEGSR